MAGRSALVEWHRRLAVNSASGVRQKVARAIRRIADRVDGRKSLVIEMTSTPALPKELRERIVRKGFDHMAALLMEAARAEALEAGMRTLHPELYDEGAG